MDSRGTHRGFILLLWGYTALLPPDMEEGRHRVVRGAWGRDCLETGIFCRSSLMHDGIENRREELVVKRETTPKGITDKIM